MTEYISRDKVLKKFIEGDGHDDDRFTEGYNFAVQEHREEVENIPAADVQPMKHGCWITSHPVDAAKEFKCIVCGGLIELPVFAEHCYYDYCPYCGARMDGDTE